MTTKVLAVALAVFVLGGIAACALFAIGTESASEVEGQVVKRASASSSRDPSRTCLAAGRRARGSIHLCRTPAVGDPGAFYVETGDSWRILPVAEPAGTSHRGVVVGHWSWARLSPNGRTLLAQWPAECKVPIAFFVDARGGHPRAVTGQRRWQDAPQSIALGWTPAGDARVALPEGACGKVHRRPGVYVVSPRGGMRYQGPYDRRERPRTIDERT
ncbi:MAG: hypothetical protein ABR583_13910 [Gaiellaceae bacterium]